MDMKEYLLAQDDLNLSKFAKRMWPNNKNAKTYLSAKLNGLDKRTFTEADEKLARKALKELITDLNMQSKSK